MFHCYLRAWTFQITVQLITVSIPCFPTHTQTQGKAKNNKTVCVLCVFREREKNFMIPPVTGLEKESFQENPSYLVGYSRHLMSLQCHWGPRQKLPCRDHLCPPSSTVSEMPTEGIAVTLLPPLFFFNYFCLWKHLSNIRTHALPSCVCMCARAHTPG